MGEFAVPEVDILDLVVGDDAVGGTEVVEFLVELFAEAVGETARVGNWRDDEESCSGSRSDGFHHHLMPKNDVVDDVPVGGLPEIIGSATKDVHGGAGTSADAVAECSSPFLGELEAGLEEGEVGADVETLGASGVLLDNGLEGGENTIVGHQVTVSGPNLTEFDRHSENMKTQVVLAVQDMAVLGNRL